MKNRIAIAQFCPEIGNLDANRRKILNCAEAAIDQGAELLLLPELCLTGYLLRDEIYQASLTPDDSFLEPIKKISKKIALAIGVVEGTSDHRYFNSAFYYERGELCNVTRKVYLPTYGVFEEKRFFAEGERIRAFDSRFGRMGIAICNDLWHPALPWLLAMDGANIILVLSASPTRGVSGDELNDNERVWSLLLAHTAKSSSVYVAYANLCGYQDGLNFWGGSRLYTPNGRVVAQANAESEEMFVAEIDHGAIRRERVYSPLRRDERLLLTYHELERIVKERYR